MYLKKKNDNNKSLELRYDLIPFGYVGSLVFVTKFSHICILKTKKKKKAARKKQANIDLEINEFLLIKR